MENNRVLNDCQNTDQKKAGVVGYTEIRQSRPQNKTVTRDKEGHFITIFQAQNKQENVTIQNVPTPDNRASRHMKRNLTELQGETGPHL